MDRYSTIVKLPRPFGDADSRTASEAQSQTLVESCLLLYGFAVLQRLRCGTFHDPAACAMQSFTAKRAEVVV
jgi:hypothetical protein